MSIYIQMSAGVLWTVALGLMAVAPATAMPIYFLGWSLTTSTIAAVLTGWVMLQRERHRVEAIAELAIQVADEHRRLESI